MTLKPYHFFALHAPARRWVGHLASFAVVVSLVGCPTDDSAPAGTSGDDTGTLTDTADDAGATSDGESSDSGGLDSGVSDTGELSDAEPTPDTTEPETTQPDTTPPDTTAPDTTAPDTTPPDTTAPDTGEADTSLTDVAPNDAEVTADTDTGADVGGMDAGPDVVLPTTEGLCADEIDDDNDGATDCDDADCAFDVACTPTCAPVGTIGCEASITASTTDAAATTVLAEYPCLDGFHTGPELAWSFTVDEPTWVLAALQNESDQTALMVIQALDGACFAGQCIAGDEQDLLFLAQPGETWFFVVDGLDGDTGSFELATTCEVCAPDCTGKICGDDGCGGHCGVCDDGSSCSADGSACLEPVAGDSCTDAVAIDPGALPWTQAGTTIGALDDYDAVGDDCEPAGFSGGGDVVYRFTPTETALYRFSAEQLLFDATLSVTEGCDGTCLDGADTLGDESVEVGLAAGKTYFITVDGLDELEAGDFVMSAAKIGTCTPSCGGCGAPDGCGGTCPCDPVDNDTCGEATTIDPNDLPTTITATTAGGQDDYAVATGQCSPGPGYSFGQGGADVVYSITPTQQAAYTLSLAFDANTFDASLYVTRDCADLSTGCIGAAELESLGGEQLTVAMDAGVTYFVIVDGYKSNQGNFTLHVDACSPDCTGKVCGTDGCGGTCGECSGDDICLGGTCLVPSGCETVSFEGCCDGTTLHFCDDGELSTVECVADGTCGWDADSGWYTCGASGSDPNNEHPIDCVAP